MIVTTQRGMGDALVAPPAYATCSPLNSACVAANETLANNYDASLATAQAQNNYSQCLTNAANANSPAQYAQVMAACNGQFITQAPTGASPVYTGGPGSVPFSYPTNQGGNPGGVVGQAAPSFSFVASGGNPGSMNVGDTWYVSISGASPSTSVTVSGSQNGTTFGTVTEGVTDASGSFSTSGTVGTGNIGSWQEIWAVGGQAVGQIIFTVNPVAGTLPPSVAPASSIVAGSTNGSTAPVASTTVFDLFGDTSTPISIGSFQIGEYTALGLATALVVGYMMMSHKRR